MMLPPFAQPPGYHAFADQHACWGLPLLVAAGLISGHTLKHVIAAMAVVAVGLHVRWRRQL